MAHLLRVRTTFSGATGSPWLATHYFLEDTPTQTLANSANSAVGTFWGAIAALMRTGITYATGGQVDQLNLSGDLEGAFAVTPATGSGSNGTADILPFATQALVRWNTGLVLGGRFLKGRTYIPGLTEGSSVAGTLNSVDRTTILNAANALISDVNSKLAVWSRASAGAATATGADVWQQFAVLRSRRD